MNISEKTIPDFIDLLASKSAIPGGGGASALIGAIGIALGNMVASLTIGKKKYADVESDMIHLQKEAEALHKKFIMLIDKDAEAFEPLAKAYSLPANTDDEKFKKENIMEECLINASKIPLEIMRHCAEAVKLCGIFADKGSRLAISDAGAGVIFCKAAMHGASLNVYINTKYMKDRDYAKKINDEADKMLSEYTVLADNIFLKVKEAIT